MSQQFQRVYEFDSFRIDGFRRLLTRDGQVVQLTPKAFDVLLALVEGRGELVQKGDLMKRVWPDTFVEEGNLTNNISTLRRALGEQMGQHQYIVTIPGRGYRFVASVLETNGDSLILEERSTTSITVEESEESHKGIENAGPVLVSDQTAKENPWLLRNWRTVAAGTVVVLLAVAAWIFLCSPRKEVLTDKDSILIADFVNKTGDEVFDGALKQALAIDLEQSPFLAIFPEEKIRETLRYMKAADQPLTRSVAQEVCRRQGIKAFLTGSISSFGGHYVIGIEAINAQTGSLIVREQMEADSKEAIIQSLGKAATKLRERLGDSLHSIQKF